MSQEYPNDNPHDVDARVLLHFSPADIGGAATLLSMKVDAVRGASSAHATIPGAKFFPDIKISKLRMHYAQVFGRLMVLGTTVVLPHHSVHPEELAVQLFLLSVSMKPILRSVQLYHCITNKSAKGNSCGRMCPGIRRTRNGIAYQVDSCCCYCVKKAKRRENCSLLSTVYIYCSDHNNTTKEIRYIYKRTTIQ